MTTLYVLGCLACIVAAARNLSDGIRDKYRTVRVLSWILVPLWLATGVVLGVVAWMEATP